MKCEDIEQALNQSGSDLRAVSKHLESCHVCRTRYAQDLSLETALRDLKLDCESIDITHELSQKLLYPKKSLNLFIGLRKLVWLSAGAILLTVLIANINLIFGWLDWLIFNLSNQSAELRLLPEPDLNQLSESLVSWKYFEYFVFFIAMATGSIVAYLWREFREIVE